VGNALSFISFKKTILSVYFEGFLGTIEIFVEIDFFFCWKLCANKGHFNMLYKYEFTWIVLCRTVEHEWNIQQGLVVIMEEN